MSDNNWKKTFATILCSGLISALLFSACATGQVKTGAGTSSGRPAWIDGASPEYPVSKYLTGVGRGRDRDLAEAGARAEIARIFRSEVNSRQKIYQEYVQVISKGKENVEDSVSVEDLTEITTSRVMSGARIAEVFEDPGVMHYALAVLERGPTSEQLENKIRELDQAVLDEWNRAQAETERLPRIRMLSRALNFYLQRDALNADLGVIGRRTIPSELNGAELKAQVESELFHGTTMSLAVVGSRAEDIHASLTEALNQQGFSVGGSPNPDVRIEVRVRIEPLDRADPKWTYALWTLSMEMTDSRQGKVFGSYQKTDREAHLTWQSAEERAVRAISIVLRDEVAGQVRKYLLGE
ncbi:MAG: LPP20 family lipoprotein [Pseudomonadota bacterium]